MVHLPCYNATFPYLLVSRRVGKVHFFPLILEDMCLIESTSSDTQAAFSI